MPRPEDPRYTIIRKGDVLPKLDIESRVQELLANNLQVSPFGWLELAADDVRHSSRPHEFIEEICDLKEIFKSNPELKEKLAGALHQFKTETDRAVTTHPMVAKLLEALEKKLSEE